MKTVRLDKFLCDAAGLTRTEAKTLIRRGEVCVDGETVRKPETKVEETASGVALYGELLRAPGPRYYMLNKPQGVVTATRDGRSETVMDLLDEPDRNLFPIGRLDRDTEGLLLITNDGKLSHDLLSPAKHVDKRYLAILDGEIGEREIEAFAGGLSIGDEKPCLPAILEAAEGELQPSGGRMAVYITLQEGRYHQVKRMAEAVGREVLFLKRVMMGGLVLDPDLEPGEYRELREDEVSVLRGGGNR